MIRETLLSRAFASAGAEEQANLINCLARELHVVCKGSSGLEMQCCYISDDLNRDGIALIKKLYEFIELREEEMGT